MKATHQLLHDQAITHRTQLDRPLAKGVAEFNAMLAEKKLAGVVAKP